MYSITRDNIREQFYQKNNAKELSDVTSDCIFQQCVLQFGPRPRIASGTMESTVPPAPR